RSLYLKKTIIFELAISAIIDNESSRISINLIIKYTSFYSFLPKEFYRIMLMSAITANNQLSGKLLFFRKSRFCCYL
ncbi:MAG: hypothetical protein E7E05_05370, partial [Streptococcus salivarius]|nr:hypothetical protein [Streptococcus salivarius]